MSQIICGRFDRTLDADAALQALRSQGFAESDIDTFYVGPPGQNARTPLGGDAPHSSEGSRRAGVGAGIGAAIGFVVGLAAGLVGAIDLGPPTVPLAALLGALVGSFAGAMSTVEPGERRYASVEHPVEPRGGRMIAVHAEDREAQQRAASILRQNAARNVGRAEGDWRDGWRDFDPRLPLSAV